MNTSNHNTINENYTSINTNTISPLMPKVIVVGLVHVPDIGTQQCIQLHIHTNTYANTKATFRPNAIAIAHTSAVVRIDSQHQRCQYQRCQYYVFNLGHISSYIEHRAFTMDSCALHLYHPKLILMHGVLAITYEPSSFTHNISTVSRELSSVAHGPIHVDRKQLLLYIPSFTSVC